MTESVCSYSGNRDEALVTFLYDEDGRSAGERATFGAHLSTCAACRDELDAMRGVRAELGRWNPPEPNFAITFSNAPRAQSAIDQQSTIGNQQWWRSVPAWAQVAAALLFLGVSARIANLDVRYDSHGLSVRTGGSRVAATAAPTLTSPDGGTPWKADLTALEQQLTAEMRTARSAAPAPLPTTVRAADPDLARRLRALIDESEKRQQRELALRIAEVLRDVNVQRQADLAKVNRALGAVENNLGVEVLKTRQQVNLMYRASQVVR
jgi:hypothetical protein